MAVFAILAGGCLGSIAFGIAWLAFDFSFLGASLVYSTTAVSVSICCLLRGLMLQEDSDLSASFVHESRIVRSS